MKKLTRIFTSALIMLLMSSSIASATNTILPNPEGIDITTVTEKECLNIVNGYLEFEDMSKQLVIDGKDQQDLLLACAIKSGKIKFWMFPFFIRYILQFLISLSGLLAVLMVLVGAYYYIAGGITDDKEKGKKIIQYALGGLVLVLLSWFIVNLLLLILTA
jgi:hypothetical protein